MTTTSPVLPLLVFEAADCLMAVPASEIAHLEGADPVFAKNESPMMFDLDKHFSGRESAGPWLRWQRGSRMAWLRVQRVVDVVPMSLAHLVPMPALLRGQQRTRAFLASGVHEDAVFLLLDPERLTASVPA